ncbi:SDR family NAD(P)-dependent oxidoreductase [Sulfurimonas marina]|uniref:SDR family NAD(P)-dependent oxidoreductase n=1 Tax=Sulfurimonas marina TaxID=2590551 RepID=A0A7M1AVH6_9BACT|nr:SDR family NAD(P)-dependent oxidoreductase [Sulfurimonas marina]QOP41386.1 SDR family NAD(P)-dependent oxidoreductase [Sulfurimonas marina]
MIFITGSTDGLGLLAAKELIRLGHEVVLHARSKKRLEEVANALPKSAKVLVADLSNMQEVKHLAKELNTLGSFDTIIHNAGVYQAPKDLIFKVNVLAPFILSSLLNKPKQMIFINSNMHPHGSISFENLSLESGVDYSTSKLQLLMLALAIGRRVPELYLNSVDPGWVPTKMANYSAPDSLEEGSATQVWLASSQDADLNKKYFYHMKEAAYDSKADNIAAQDQLIKKCEEMSGVEFLYSYKGLI